MPNAAKLAPLEEDRISPRNFIRLANLIQSETGIKMPENKRTMLEGRLRRRVHANQLPNLDAYCQLIFDPELGLDERLHLINAVTTNKTDFFREPRHFDYLVSDILPTLRRRGNRRIRAWCAACSTGAEPYTLAMYLDDNAQNHGGADYGILATDIDTNVLQIARRGIYPVEMMAPVPKNFRQRYVMESRDAKRREARIVPSLRSAVGFARMNLMDARYPVGDPMDLIFCRNVLIYFERDMQEKVLSRLCERLRIGGWLLLGHSESISGMKLPVKQVANNIFERV